MDKLQKDGTFLTNYEIEEGKITEYYSNNSKVTNIPNIPHNVNVCERRLLRQHLEAKEKGKERLDNVKKIKGIEISMLGMLGILSLTINSSLGVLLASYYMVQNFRDIQKEKRNIWRLMITDYCLEHATSLKFSEKKKDASSTLSEKGKEAFKKDRGFSLNHAHLYTNNDLKILKKVIGQ